MQAPCSVGFGMLATRCPTKYGSPHADGDYPLTMKHIRARLGEVIRRPVAPRQLMLNATYLEHNGRKVWRMPCNGASQRPA